MRSIITLILIIALTWYAKQGQNNPFRDVRVVKITTIENITSLISYAKKRDNTSSHIMVPLKLHLKDLNSLSRDLSIYTIIDLKNDSTFLNSNKQFKNVINIQELENEASHRNISFSESKNIMGAEIRNIYINESKDPIAHSLLIDDISIIVINDPLNFLSLKQTEDLKEKFMVAILSKGSQDIASKVRNRVRPEYLITLSDSNEEQIIENIVHLPKDKSLRISKNIKGMIKLKSED